jgi:alkyl hydroperoxide reductase subunit F
LNKGSYELKGKIILIREETVMDHEIYDSIIIGGGPGGVAAAIYAGRKKMKTLVVTESFGGQSVVSSGIQNWIGEVKITGSELADKFEKHLLAQEGIDIKMPEKVTAVTEGADRTFEVKTERNGLYRARTVIIASGAQSRRLNVPGEGQFDGKGVAYCSTCDAPFFKDADVAVVGSGNSALETVMDLQTYAKNIYLLIRGDQPKGDPVNRDKVVQSPKVHIINHVEIQEIFGDQTVKGVRYKKETGETRELPVEGVFVEIGSVPNSAFLNGLVEKNQSGEIVVNHLTARASKEGIFAVGDVTDDLYKQNNTAAGDGVRAALSAYHYVEKFKKFSPCEEKEEGALDALLEKKKAYQDKIEAHLKEWGVSVDEFRARAESSKAELKMKYRETIEDLRMKQEALQKRLIELKKSGEEAWEELRPLTEKSFGELKEALDQTISKFKKSEEEMVERVSKKKKAYLEKIESQLREWNTKIEVLKAKAEKLEAEARIKYFEEIKELRKKQDTIKQKLHEMRGSGGEAWEDLKGGLDQAMDDLKEGLKDALSRVKGK